MRTPIVLDDPTFNDRLGRLVTANGDLERSGVTLEEVSDMIFTRMTRINPSIGEQIEAASTKEKVPRTKKEKVMGEKMDDLLG